MNKIEPICLSTLIEESKDGEWGKGEPLPNHTEMLVIRGTAFEKLKSGSIEGIPKRYIPKAIAGRKKLQANDILIETAGGTEDMPTGRVVFISEKFISQNGKYEFTCASFSRFIRIDVNKAVPSFIYWYLRFLYEARISYMFHTQHTGVARFQWTKFSNYKLFSLPDSREQEIIASLLNCYDDFIELNNHRINLLEESAREIYKEWFVRKRFPDFQNIKFLKGAPINWEVLKVKDLVDRKKFGRTYKPHELLINGKIVVIGQSSEDLVGYHNNLPDHTATSETPMIIFGDHTCKMRVMIEPFSLAENVIPFSSKKNMPIYYLFFLIESLVETTEYKRHWGELISKEVLVADIDLQEKYSVVVKPFFEQIEILKSENDQLRQIRDRFLPRLISGKLKVKKTDKVHEQN